MATEKEPGTRPEANTFYGTRKLVRPSLPLLNRHRENTHGDTPLTQARMGDEGGGGSRESSHAEVFYFQKQVQQHTELTVVLDDGEELTGTVEWYDKCVLKLRAGRRRVMVYKSGIRYLYKSSEVNAGPGVMK